MQVITNQQYEIALKNKDYIQVAKKALKSFKLTSSERHESWLIGLWNALKRFEEDKHTKFTTWLYNEVRWAASEVVKNKKISDNQPLHKNLCDDVTEDILYQIVPDDLRNLLEDKVLGRYSNKELQLKYGISANRLKTLFTRIKNFLVLEKNGV